MISLKNRIALGLMGLSLVSLNPAFAGGCVKQTVRSGSASVGAMVLGYKAIEKEKFLSLSKLEWLNGGKIDLNGWMLPTTAGASKGAKIMISYSKDPLYIRLMNKELSSFEDYYAEHMKYFTDGKRESVAWKEQQVILSDRKFATYEQAQAERLNLEKSTKFHYSSLHADSSEQIKAKVLSLRKRGFATSSIKYVPTSHSRHFRGLVRNGWVSVGVAVAVGAVTVEQIASGAFACYHERELADLERN